VASISLHVWFIADGCRGVSMTLASIISNCIAMVALTPGASDRCTVSVTLLANLEFAQ